jgi:hypothetical protein
MPASFYLLGRPTPMFSTASSAIVGRTQTEDITAAPVEERTTE